MRTLHFSAALIVMTGLMAFAQTPQAPSDEHPTLPAGPGREVMIRVCSQCHEPENAAAQELDEKGWKDLVDDMASKGADATDAELDEIVHYLAHAFPPPK